MVKKTPWESMATGWHFLNGMAQVGQAIGNSMTPDPVAGEEIDPMGGLAEADELIKFKYDPEGFYLGKIHEDHGVSFEASLPADDDRHLFVMAGTASGKGVTIGIQNALRWRGPLLAIDPKGEMAEITALHRGSREIAVGTGTSVRKFKGQKVAILDPMGAVRGAAKKYCVSYNPMGDIDMKVKGGFRKIKKLAAGMVVPEDGSNSHFSESAETLLAGAIEAVMILEKPEDHNLPFLRLKILGNVKLKDEANLTEGDEAAIEAGFQALYTYLTNDKLPDDGHAAEAASVLGEVLDSDEAGSFRTTLSRNLKWIADPDIKAHLQPSDFSLWNAVQDGWSVYLVLQPDDISDFRNWLRLTVQIALSAKMAMGTFQTGRQTLFFLDEFAALGRFKEIEDSAGYMRGYGIKLCPVIQNIGQVQQLYAKNWETFIDNSAAFIAWSFNGLDSEKYMSDRLGRIVIAENSFSTSTSTNGLYGSANKSASVALRERAVRFSNEVREQAARETMRAFVIPAGGKGFTIRRVPYMELADKKIYDSPAHIKNWETKHGH